MFCRLCFIDKKHYSNSDKRNKTTKTLIFWYVLWEFRCYLMRKYFKWTNWYTYNCSWQWNNQSKWKIYYHFYYHHIYYLLYLVLKLQHNIYIITISAVRPLIELATVFITLVFKLGNTFLTIFKYKVKWKK